MENYVIARLKIRDDFFKLYGEPTTMEELAMFVVNVSNHNQPDSQHIHGICWDVNYGFVSNSHSSPIRGVRNWGGKPDLPRSYDGFYGRVWVRKKNEDKFMLLSDRIEKSFTYTGTGGGGSYRGPWSDLESKYIKYTGQVYNEKLRLFSWDYRFYTDDFPFLIKFEEEKLIARMQGKKEPKINSKVFWESDEVKKEDDAVNKEILLLND